MAGELPPLRSIDANDTQIEGLQPTPDNPAERGFLERHRRRLFQKRWAFA